MRREAAAMLRSINDSLRFSWMRDNLSVVPAQAGIHNHKE